MTNHFAMESAVPSETSFSIDSTRIGDLSTELLVLDSLFPLVGVLPGLTKEDNSGYYYLQGKIDPSDQESLYNYAKRISVLTLGSSPESELEPRLAPHVLARIAQLQYPNMALFPSLHHLRIVGNSADLDLLHVLLSPSLTTLELTALPVDNPCYSSVLSFLECAIHQAPHLSTLILGPGRIHDQILDISLRYQHLRRLELIQVENSITDRLSQGIGSLQHLEVFVLQDVGESTYERSPAITEHATAPGPGTETDSEVSDSSGDTPNTTPSQFPQRSRCASPESTFSSESKLTEASVPTMLADPASKSFPALQSLEVCGSFTLIEDLVGQVTSLNLKTLSLDFTKSLKLAKNSTGKLEEVGVPQISTADVVALIRRSVQKFAKSLVAVTFENFHTTTFSFPHDVFGHLLLHPGMKLLEITGMDIDSTEEMLTRLNEFADSKLEALHLPIHSTAAGIRLALLRPIAKNCPHLRSFRCRFKHLSNIPRVAESPLSHQLKVLSVVNERPHPKGQRLVEIARYLDSTFPNLESIETHDGSRNNAEQWRFISKLVELCRTVRADEHRRFWTGI